MAEQFCAGAALGLLLGLLVSLSSSPVVAAVVGAVVSGMIVLLGFVRGGDAPNSESAARASSWRLSGFGLTCSIALIAGLFIRTYNLAAPRIQNQVQQLTDAGFTPDEAHALVAYKNTGIVLRLKPDMVIRDTNRIGGIGASALFASPGTDNCALFDPERYASVTEHLKALRNAGGSISAFSDSVARLNPESQTAVLNVEKLLFCP
jgi:hypothetical protein